MQKLVWIDNKTFRVYPILTVNCHEDGHILQIQYLDNDKKSVLVFIDDKTDGNIAIQKENGFGGNVLTF